MRGSRICDRKLNLREEAEYLLIIEVERLKAVG